MMQVDRQEILRIALDILGLINQSPVSSYLKSDIRKADPFEELGYLRFDIETAIRDGVADLSELEIAWSNRKVAYIETAIENIAAEYTKRSEFANSAPRVKDVRAALQQAESALTKLSNSLRKPFVEEAVSNALRSATDGVIRQPIKEPRVIRNVFNRLTDKEKVEELKKLEGYQKDFEESKALWSLKYLGAGGVEALLDILGRGITVAIDEIEIDRGSSNTAWNLWNLRPRVRLAVDCLGLFDAVLPDVASTTPTNDFTRFVESVYELATGDEEFSLDRPIADAFKFLKERQQMDGNEKHLNAALSYLKYAIDLADPFPSN